MRRFIYLDTDTLNSYLAQIYDGLIEKTNKESLSGKKKIKQNKVSVGLGAKIALSLWGKGIDTEYNAEYEHFNNLANEEMVKDVQTKILHDNAFDQFINYLSEQELLNNETKRIGQFSKIEDEFYIFDIEFYKHLFDKNGFVDCLGKIQQESIEKTIDNQYAELSRENRRSREVKGKAEELKQQEIETNSNNFMAAKTLIDMLAAIIPYPQVLCIENNLVILNEKYLRDDISTASFKYGGKINVVGYITNKVNAQANTPVSKLAGVSNSFNEIMKIFFDNVEEMFIIHPVAIYYDN